MQNITQRTTILAGRIAALLALAAALQFLLAAPAHGAENRWTIKVRDAAVVSGDRVLLGEIADAVGTVNQTQWKKLAATPLWQSPPFGSRPMAINKVKLGPALRNYIGLLVTKCQLPDRLVLQRGGALLDQAHLTRLIVNTLTPGMAALEGEPSLREFKVPDYMLLEHANNRVEAELVSLLDPGRLTVYLVEYDQEDKAVHKISASVFMDLWRNVPAAAHPLNRNEPLTPDSITHVRKNMAYTKGDLWNGRGGPWRVKRPVGANQVLLANNLEPVPAVLKGDKVTLLYEGRNVHLTVPAQVEDEGGLNETITVTNLQSQRKVFAKVRDASTVVVQ